MSTSANSENKPALSADLLAACIHCGLCLPACPTYLASGRETESPRGRIYLLNEWNSGRQDLTPRLTEHIDSCLGCLGCQTACPSGVQYEKILNQARPVLAKRRAGWYRSLMRFVFSSVLPNYSLLNKLGSLLRTYQTLGLTRIIDFIAGRDPATRKPSQPLPQASHLIPPTANLFAKLSQWQEFMPAVPTFKTLPQKSWRSGAKTGTVQFFSGCVMDVFYNHVNHACMRLLAAQSHIVENPPQTCCGALAFHAGEVDITLDLAKRNIELFEKTDGEIVVSAAGCGAMLKEYGELLHEDPEWKERAQAFSARVVDITESLNSGSFSNLPEERPDDLPESVAYHAACHLAHAQKVHIDPLNLLKHYVEDVSSTQTHAGAIPAPPRLVPLQESEHCCGSAGIYNILRPEMSLEVLERKMDFLAKTGASIVVTTNPGCMLQLEAGARSRGLRIEVKHMAQLLDDFYCEQT